MKELTELHLSLICVLLAIVGLTGILLVIDYQDPIPISIENAENYTGQFVSLNAFVSDKQVSKTNTTFLTLTKGTHKLKGVVFSNTNLNVVEKQQYVFIGVIKTYKGELEIIIESVKP